VFTSLPPSPYEVIAEMRINSPFYAQPEEGHMPRLVKRAHEIGADALLFVQGSIFFSTNYGPRGGGAEPAANGQAAPALTTVNTFNPLSFSPGVTILAIRWTDGPPPGLPSYEKAAPAAAATPPSAPAPTPAAVTDTNASSQLPPPAVTDTNATPQPTTAPVPAQPATDQTATPPVTPTNTPPINPISP
jgi:hypothetical protein